MSDTKIAQSLDIRVLKHLLAYGGDKTVFNIITIGKLVNTGNGIAPSEALPGAEAVLLPDEVVNGSVDDNHLLEHVTTLGGLDGELAALTLLAERLPDPKTQNLSKLLCYYLSKSGMGRHELGEFLGVGPRTVYTYCNRGKVMYEQLLRRERNDGAK